MNVNLKEFESRYTRKYGQNPRDSERIRKDPKKQRIGENSEESERNRDNPKIIRGNLIESEIIRKEPNKFRKSRRKTRENSRESYEIPGET